MEKFAARYCIDNPGVANDTAPVLAFSVVMLQVTCKPEHQARAQDDEGLLRNNQGIDAGQDLPRSSSPTSLTS